MFEKEIFIFQCGPNIKICPAEVGFLTNIKFCIGLYNEHFSQVCFQMVVSQHIPNNSSTFPMVVVILDFQSTQNHCIWEDHLMIIHVMYYVQFNQVSCFSHDFYTFSHILKWCVWQESNCHCICIYGYPGSGWRFKIGNR